MASKPHWIFAVLTSLLLVYTGGLLGQQFTLSTLSVSAFWPPTGIALASLILFGPISSFGIYSAFVLLNYYSFSHSLDSALVTSLFPVIQAYTAFRVFKASNKIFLLTGETEILRFYLITPIVALISPSLSSAFFFLNGTLSEQQFIINFVTWWIGDSLGMLIFTPLLLALFSHRPSWKKRRGSITTTMIALAIIIVFIFKFSQKKEQQQIETQLYSINQTFNEKLSEALETYQKNLQAINIFFLSTYHATPNEVEQFLKRLNLKADGIVYGYGWFGFADLINKARDTQYGFFTLKPYQNPLIQPPLNVIQKQYDQCAIGSYTEKTPNSSNTLYRDIEASISNIDNLCASEYLGGVAYLDIDLNALMLKIIKQLNLQDLNIRLIASNSVPPIELYTQTNQQQNNYLFIPKSDSLIKYKKTNWTLELEGQNYILNQYASTTTLWIFVSCLLFTLFSGLGLLTLFARKLQTETTVHQKTKELKIINKQLAAQIERHKESEILNIMQSKIMHMIAHEEPILDTLSQLCLYTENQAFEGSIASISLLKNEKAELFCAPSMSNSNKTLFSRFNLKDPNNPFIYSLFSGENIIIEDIQTSNELQYHPLISLNDAIHGVWSKPVKSSSGQVIANFTLIHLSPRLPDSHELQLLDTASSLTRIALERDTDLKTLKKLSNAVESSPNGIVITDSNGIIEYANPYFCDFTENSKQQLIGNKLTQFVQDTDAKDEQDFDWDYSLSLGESQRDYKGITPSGRVYWCKQTIAHMSDEQGISNHVLSIHQDITDEYTEHQLIQQQASHDSLTGLYNRAKFERYLDELLQKPRLKSKHALAFIDLDKFKAINDQCGHTAGDKLLSTISQIMQSQLRKTDFLARIGGDEFAILFEQCPEPKAHAILVDLIQTIAEYNFHWEGKTFRIGASVGLLILDNSINDKETALKRADAACYIAKEQGRQTIHTYQEGEIEQQVDVFQHHWENTLLNALEHDHFQLYVQPILNIANDNIEKYEVLLRLKNETSDLLLPGSFINEAERLNLMPKIDRWVITHTIKWLKQNSGVKKEFTINLSAQTLNSSFEHWLRKEIDLSQINTKQLCFEITEATALQDLQKTKQLIKTIHSKGCTFALDDFGSGLSSFTYLKDLDIDYLKIDGQFVKDIENDLIDREMVKAINQIGHIVGKVTIAEYAENTQINDILKTIGVDYIQGYSISKPLPINSI